MTRPPDYLGVWCETCQQDCLPLGNRTCGFCDTAVVDADGQPLHHQPHQEDDDVPDDACKIDGCARPRHDKLGMYGGLCLEHREHAKAARAAKPQAAADSPAQPQASSSLVQLAQAVEDARAALDVALDELRKAVA